MQLCEFIVKEKLKAPATYSRASLRRAERGVRPVLWIDFDAANRYGTPIRGLAECELFKQVSDGKFDVLKLAIDGKPLDSLSLETALMKWKLTNSGR